MMVLKLLILLSMTFGAAYSENSNRCSMPTDIIFLLDGSSNVFYDDWMTQKSFAESIIESLDIKQDEIRVGLVAFGHMVHNGSIIYLEPFLTKPELKAHLKDIHRLLGDTNTGLGIEKVREMFKSQGRPEATFIAVVLTGKSANQSFTIEQAQAAKTEGIVMTAAGIGQNIDISELKEIATDEWFSFNVFDVESLSRILDDFTEGKCGGREDLTCNPLLRLANGYANFQVENGTKVAVTNLNKNKEGRIVFTRQRRLGILSLSGVELREKLFINITYKMSPLPPRRNPLLGQQQRSLQPLVANCEPMWNGKKPSIWIFVGPSTVEIGIKTDKEDNPATFNMHVESGFNTVALTYDGSQVMARVNGVQETQPLTGNIERRETGISLGQCRGFSSFLGEVSEFTISRCVPKTGSAP